MRRFRFRLERLGRWRRQLEARCRHAHARAAHEATLAEAALREHDEYTRCFIEEQALRRAKGAVTVETFVTAEASRRELFGRRNTLEVHRRDVARCEEAAREDLMGARRDVKIIENLARARLARWRRELDVEIQKLADEAHRARRVLEAARVREEAREGRGSRATGGTR